MPIGRLDGGRVAMAVAGRQTAGGISFATLVSQAISFLFSNSISSPISLFWIIAVVFLQRGADIPPEDDCSSVSSGEGDKLNGYFRALGLAFCIIMTAGILLPVPINIETTAGLIANPDILQNLSNNSPPLQI
jgi:hypothetical protein